MAVAIASGRTAVGAAPVRIGRNTGDQHGIQSHLQPYPASISGVVIRIGGPFNAVVRCGTELSRNHASSRPTEG